ncbi:MAG: xanthine dehydrogenase family protein subunit M [Clostridiaceae bacterium]
MKIKQYYNLDNIEKSYEILQKKNSLVVGGGAFLHLGDREVENAIDISNLGLDYIKNKQEYIEIGASTTLREIEKSEILKNNFHGIVSKTVSKIMGVQIRNMATIGGTVFGRYGFSDLLTSLLSLDTTVELYKNGKMSLEEFLESDIQKDILTKIIIKKDGRCAKYLNMRNTSTDFSMLNVAVSRKDNEFKISVGARPNRAKLCYEASNFMAKSNFNYEDAKQAGEIAANELNFGKDIRASKEYRKELCSVLVKRAILEVL